MIFMTSHLFIQYTKKHISKMMMKRNLLANQQRSRGGSSSSSSSSRSASTTSHISGVLRHNDINYKNQLSEYTQHQRLAAPTYSHEHYGEDHAKVFKCFCSIQMNSGVSLQTEAVKSTKKEAEKEAACKMLIKIDKLTDGEPLDCDDEFYEVDPIETPPLFRVAVQSIIQDGSQLDKYSFGGDSLLRCSIADHLYSTFPQFGAGLLTTMVSEAVEQKTRAIMARRLGLDSFMQSALTNRTRAEMYSAAIAAYYLKLPVESRDYELTEFVLNHYRDYVAEVVAKRTNNNDTTIQQCDSNLESGENNFIGKLQEFAQKGPFSLPSYLQINENGPEHAREYTFSCVFNNDRTVGNGGSIKAAKQEAAKLMCKRIFKKESNSLRTLVRSDIVLHSVEGRLQQFCSNNQFENLTQNLNWSFRSVDNLRMALTHCSIDHNNNYERLEFLGDAVLKQMLVFSILFDTNSLNCNNKAVLSPFFDELVCAKTQAKISDNLQLSEQLLTQCQQISEAMKSDILESVVGALYLDAKETARLQQLKRMIRKWFTEELKDALKK